MDLYGNMENNLKLKSDIILHNLNNLIVEIENNINYAREFIRKSSFNYNTNNNVS